MAKVNCPVHCAGKVFPFVAQLLFRPARLELIGNTKKPAWSIEVDLSRITQQIGNACARGFESTAYTIPVVAARRALQGYLDKEYYEVITHYSDTPIMQVLVERQAKNEKSTGQPCATEVHDLTPWFQILARRPFSGPD